MFHGAPDRQVTQGATVHHNNAIMGDHSEEFELALRRARSTGDVPFPQWPLPYDSIAALLAHQAEVRDDAPFLIYCSDDGRRQEYSYRDFFENACRAANALRAHGVQRGDLVTVLSPTHADVVVQYFAIWLLGAVVMPVHTGEDTRSIAVLLRHSGCRTALVRDSEVERFLAAKNETPGLTTVLVTGQGAAHGLSHFSAETARQPARLPRTEGGSLHDRALLLYTSGATGDPKGVLLDQYNLLAEASTFAEWHRLSEDQRLMCVLPLHHVNGIVVTLMTPLCAGGSVVLNERFHSDRFFERISTEKVTVVSVVPTLLQFLISARLEMESYKLAHFRHLICGGGPLTVELATKFEQKFAIPVVHGYGLTETTSYACSLPADLGSQERRSWLSKHGFPSIGTPLPVNDMAIHDDGGSELEENQRGEIVIRGHNVMREYYHAPDATAAATERGWLRTGDEGFYVYDEEGRRFFFVTGRMKELIIRGGANISPLEIDEVLLKMPGVQAAVAVGFDNDWYGEEVGAFVVPKPDAILSEEAVIAFCRKSLPFVKSPKVVLFGAEIPHTSTGERQREKLKDVFAEWKSVQFSTPR